MNEQARQAIREFDDATCIFMVTVLREGETVYIGRCDISAWKMEDFVQRRMGDDKSEGKYSVELDGFGGSNAYFEWEGSVTDLLQTMLDIWQEMAN